MYYCTVLVAQNVCLFLEGGDWNITCPYFRLTLFERVTSRCTVSSLSEHLFPFQLPSPYVSEASSKDWHSQTIQSDSQTLPTPAVAACDKDTFVVDCVHSAFACMSST